MAPNLISYIFVFICALLLGQVFIFSPLLCCALIALFLVAFIICVSSIDTCYLLYFFSLVWMPLWINSYSLFGVRFGFLTINYPLIFLVLFIVKLSIEYYAGRIILNIAVIDFFILGFLVYSALSLLRSTAGFFIRDFYLFAFPVLNYFITKYAPLNRAGLIRIFTYLIYFSIPIVFYLLFESLTKINIFLPPKDIYQHAFYMYDTRAVYQPGASFADPNQIGLFLAMMVSLCFYLMRISTNKSKYFFIYSAFFISTGVLLTLSRSAALSLMAVLAINLFFFSRRKGKLFILALPFIALGIFLILYLGLPAAVKHRIFDEVTVRDRISYFLDSIQLIKKNLILGVGFENFRYRSLSGVGGPTHNLFTSILTEFGLVGALPMIFVAFLLSRKFIRLRKRIIVDRSFTASVAGIVWAYLISGIGHSVNIFYQASSIFWIVISLYLNHAEKTVANENITGQ